MPNQNFCGPYDNMNLVNCDLNLTNSYNSCQPTEKICRFAYASWCPVCDNDVQRRRSRSECTDYNFRKRGRDMKTPSPKKRETFLENKDCLELQNIRLDSSRVRTNLCELPTTYITNNCQTNVPLTSDMSHTAKYSNFSEPIHGERSHRGCSHDVPNHGNLRSMNGMRNSINNGTNRYQNVPYTEEDIDLENGLQQCINIGNPVFRGPSPSQSRKIIREKSPFEHDINMSIKQKIIQAVRNQSSDVSTIYAKKSTSPSKRDLDISNPSPKDRTSPIDRSSKASIQKTVSANQTPRKLPPTPREVEIEKRYAYDLGEGRDKLNIFKSQLVPPIDVIIESKNARSNNSDAKHNLNPSPSTPIKTLFERIPVQNNNLGKSTKVSKKLPARPATAPYSKKSVDIKENSPEKILTARQNIPLPESKRNRVRQRCDSDQSNDILPEKQVEEACTVITKKAREVSPPQENKKDLRSKSIVKLASIKNRHKLSSTKLKRVRSKIAHSVSSDSNYSDSDYSDSAEEGEELSDQTGDMCCIVTSSQESIGGSTPITALVTVLASGDGAGLEEKLPIRPSLFAHIPPYISFSRHDSEVFKLPPGVGKVMKWRLSNITPIVIRKTLVNTGFRLVRSESIIEESNNDWIGTWGKHLKSNCFQSLRETQKLNHFPGTFQIGRKDRLWKNLHKLMLKFGQKEFGFIPRTFVLPQDYKLMRQVWEKTQHDTWIIKPPAAARGTGIRVIRKWTHLPRKKPLIVQQYISNPYLINGSKFDLRLYVLVTSFNPLRIYLYPEGLARFASTKYSENIDTLGDRFMHLTNYSINKQSEKYHANEDANACKGHKWTLTKLWEYLEKSGVNTKNIWRSLQQLVIKTMICGESSISALFKANVNNRYSCYELFGVDVLLDERMKPWLLEVNISPSLHSASPLDLHVKGPMVQTLLNLAQFHLPPKFSRVRKTPPPLNSDIYTTQLTMKERLKQIHFLDFQSRDDYIKDILRDLSGDDVRYLTQAEDELQVIGKFERIFPTMHTHHYFQFMEIRYYNRLFDAWETKYEKNRTQGIKILQSLCDKKVHLQVAVPASKDTLNENAPLESSTDVSADPSINRIETATSPNVALVRPQTCPTPIRQEPHTFPTKSLGLRSRVLKLSPAIVEKKPATPV